MDPLVPVGFVSEGPPRIWVLPAYPTCLIGLGCGEFGGRAKALGFLSRFSFFAVWRPIVLLGEAALGGVCRGRVGGGLLGVWFSRKTLHYDEMIEVVNFTCQWL